MSEAVQHSFRANPLLCRAPALVKQDNFPHYIFPPPPVPTCRRPSTCKALNEHETLALTVYRVMRVRGRPTNYLPQLYVM